MRQWSHIFEWSHCDSCFNVLTPYVNRLQAYVVVGRFLWTVYGVLFCFALYVSTNVSYWHLGMILKRLNILNLMLRKPFLYSFTVYSLSFIENVDLSVLLIVHIAILIVGLLLRNPITWIFEMAVVIILQKKRLTWKLEIVLCKCILVWNNVYAV